MEKIIYLILGRENDKFEIMYVGDCLQTSEKSFFIEHSSYKCWIANAGSEKSLYLAILPLFDSSDEYRRNVCHKIITQYKPSCNLDDKDNTIEKVTYTVRKSQKSDEEKFSCPCCGAQMKSEKILEKSTIYKCVNCGLSDTKLNS